MANAVADTMNRLIDRIGALPLAALIGLGAGAFTLVIHNSIFETLILATGLNELIPAAAPPLGLTARIAIAVATALFTMGVCAVLFSMMDDADDDADYDENYDFSGNARDHDDTEPSVGIAERVRNFLPFSYGSVDAEDNDVRDLPRTRRADSHPDAPVRAPLLAGRDLTEDEQEAIAASDESDSKPPVRKRLRNLLPVELLRGEDGHEGEPLVVKRRDNDVLDSPADESGEDDVILAPPPEAFEPEPSLIAEEPESDGDNGLQAASLAAALAHSDAEKDDVSDDVSEDDTPAFEAEFADSVEQDVELEPETDAEAAESLSDLSIDALIERLERGLDQLAANHAKQPLEAVAAPVATAVPPTVPEAQDMLELEEVIEISDPVAVERITESAAPVAEEIVTAEPLEEQLVEPVDTIQPEPSPVTQPEDVDAALKAALETLRQMTEEQRNAS
ncbi:MAG: hypothetical protein AAGH53_07055 [Pseudomonadota bacterium]